MPPFNLPTIHDGVVVLAEDGVILPSRHVHQHSDSTKPLSSHGSSKTLSRQNPFASPLTSLARERPEPAADRRCRDGSVAHFATRRPSPSTVGGPRRQ